MKKCWSE